MNLTVKTNKMRQETNLDAEVSFRAFEEQRCQHWEWIGQHYRRTNPARSYYHTRMLQVYQRLISRGKKVLEIGCGDGKLLAAVEPAYGVGIDFSPQMLALARQHFPQLVFINADAHTFDLKETFDYVIISDLVNDLWDVQKVLQNIRQVCTPRTRLVINFYNRLWEIPLKIAQKLGLAQPMLQQNWLTRKSIHNLLLLNDFEVITSAKEILFPLQISGLTPFLNLCLAKFWPFTGLTLTCFEIARLAAQPAAEENPLHKISIIIPVLNEKGNIQETITRIPLTGIETEILFIDGGSTDGSKEEILAAMAADPQTQILLYQQPGAGKWDAIRFGIEKASGDICMLLDADLTVPPEALPRFLDPILTHKAEFINGVRLIYPYAKGAMRSLNYLGNRFFSFCLAWVIGQPVEDTLCGTKVFWSRDYQEIASQKPSLGDMDPFGDFFLLLGAAKLNLKIMDMPIRYKPRTAGRTKINPLKHGWSLFQLFLQSVAWLKFK